MEKNLKKKLFVFVFVWVLLSFVKIKAQSVVSDIKIENGYIFLPIRINNKGPYYLELDTGAEMSLIDRNLAQKLGLKTILDKTITINTINGQVKAEISIATLQLADFLVRVPLAVIDLKERYKKSVDVIGVIGNDVLQKSVIAFDRKRKIFIISHDPFLETSGVGLAINKNGVLKTISITTDDDVKNQKTFLLDTGINKPIVFSYKASGINSSIETTTYFFSIHSKQQAEISVKQIEFKLGSVSEKLESVVIPRLKNTDFKQYDGLFPPQTLDSFYMDMYNNIFVPNPVLNKSTTPRLKAGACDEQARG